MILGMAVGFGLAFIAAALAADKWYRKFKAMEKQHEEYKERQLETVTGLMNKRDEALDAAGAAKAFAVEFLKHLERKDL